MSSSIASLFGPSAEEIVFAREQQERTRQQQQLQSALAAQQTPAARNYYESGYNIAMGLGKGLAGMFGYSEQLQDPRIAKSLAMRKVFSGLSAEDLNDPSKISMLSQMADQYDLPELKLWTADRERKLLEEESVRSAREAKAAADAAETYSGAGTFIDPSGRRFNGIRNSKGVIFEVLQNGSLQRAPQNTVKAPLEEKAAGTPSQVLVDQTLKYIEGHPQFSELDKKSRKLLSIDLAGKIKAKTNKGTPSDKAVREALSEIAKSGKVKEEELSTFSKIINSAASFIGIDELISPDVSYDALNLNDEQTSVAQTNTESTSVDNMSEEISGMQFDETAGERPAFLEDGTVVIIGADGNVVKTLPIKLTKEQMKEYGIYE